MLVGAASLVHAQDYPSRPIRMVLPFAAGGTADIVGRPLAQKMSESLGQNVIIDNRGGAGGTVAAVMVAKAAADGYTLLLASSGAITVLPNFTKVPYDPLSDFAAVGQVVSGQLILLVHPMVPARSVRELVALAKAKPGGLSYGSAGGVGQLAGELFNSLAGVRMVHVAYRGGGPMTVDLLSGQMDLAFPGLSGFVQHVKAGRVRALAVTGAKRSTALPDLPTITAAGLPGYEATTFWGLLAPAQTPVPILRRLNQAIVDAVKQSELVNYYVSQGNDPAADSPEAFAQVIKAELEKWRRVVKAAAITGE
jgi:tripartite-type tricarboxylate transporter receptor subunit TctC